MGLNIPVATFVLDGADKSEIIATLTPLWSSWSIIEMPAKPLPTIKIFCTRQRWDFRNQKKMISRTTFDLF